jgi:hypothetical protein
MSAVARDEYALKAQRMLWPLVGTLQEVEDALDAILGMMPEAPEEMLCAHVPPDFVLEIEGGLYFMLEENLRPMIAALKALAVLTRVDVARHQEIVQLRQVN